MATVTFKMDGLDGLSAAMDRLGAGMKDILERAVYFGAGQIAEATQENLRTIPSKNLRRAGEPIWDTGKLAESFHVQIEESDANHAIAQVGTDVIYARRVEFGFSGADRLGRIYNQPPNPYFRPAFDDNVERVKREMEDSVRQDVLEEIQSLGPRGGRRRTR